MLFAARDGAWGSFDPQGLPEMVQYLTGLDPDASRALLEERLGDVTADEVVERIVTESRRNPLALLELPGGLTPGPAQQVVGPSVAAPHDGHVGRVFLDRSSVSRRRSRRCC